MEYISYYHGGPEDNTMQSSTEKSLTNLYTCFCDGVSISETMLVSSDKFDSVMNDLQKENDDVKQTSHLYYLDKIVQDEKRKDAYILHWNFHKSINRLPNQKDIQEVCAMSPQNKQNKSLGKRKIHI